MIDPDLLARHLDLVLDDATIPDCRTTIAARCATITTCRTERA